MQRCMKRILTGLALSRITWILLIVLSFLVSRIIWIVFDRASKADMTWIHLTVAELSSFKRRDGFC